MKQKAARMSSAGQGSKQILPEHLERLQQESGLTPDTIRAAGLWSATRADVARLVGFDAGSGGIVFPYPGTDDFCRIRLDKPYQASGWDSLAKYLTPPGAGNRLYVPPNLPPRTLEGNGPLVITEGEKKALRACQDGIPCIATAGVWCWKQRGPNGEKLPDHEGLLPDFGKLRLKGRELVVLVYDSDITPQHEAWSAYNRLARELKRRGVRQAKVVTLPTLPEVQGKVGLDDFLLCRTTADFWQLVAAAPDWDPPREPPKAELTKGTPEGPKTPVQAVLLVQLALKAGAELFRDSTGQAFARFPIAGHREIWPIGRSGVFRQWLINLYWDSAGGPPQPEAVGQVLERLAGLAHRGPCHPVSNRVAWHDGAIWYDLSDPDWRAVRVTPAGWQVVNDPPILFRRYQHQAAQVEPVTGGDPYRLLDFVNVQDQAQRLLLLVYVISCLVPDIPHPELMVYGPQGSAKSTLHAMLKKLIDPSVVRVLSESKDKTELVQKLSHHWYAPFDNLSTLPSWAQDCFSRACTGEGDSKRQLYTDDDDFLYTYRCCVGINGINLVATKPDLLDRAIILEMEAIPKHQRRPEALLWRSFEEARPHILGGMLDALSRAMAIRPAVELNHYFRLADFTAWGYAIAEAIGWSGEDFQRAYGRNVERVQEEVLHGHPVAAAVTAFMDGLEEWKGSPSDLLRQLETVAEEQRIDTRVRLWPKAAHALTRRLNEVKTNLAAAGLRVSILREGHGGSRMILLQRVSEKASPASPEAPYYGGKASDGDAIGDAFGSEGGSSVTLRPLGDKGGDAGDGGDGIFVSPREEGIL